MAIQVEFHTGLADEVAFAARLLRKAYGQGARVIARGPGPLLAQLDRLLWTQAEREFVPHLRWDGASAPPPHAGRTPIWLVSGALPQRPPPVLVNLGAAMPESVDAFDRVIELVPREPAAADAARERWRTWRARGVAVVHHPHDQGGRDGDDA